MSQVLLVRQSGPVLARTVTEILLARGSGFDSNPDILLNTAHREGDGSDHADVELNTTHRGLTDNPHGVTAAQAGADPAGSAAAVAVLLGTHEADEANPHAVTAAQVAEDVYDNGAITVDTVLDWANGPVQSLTMEAIANLSFTNWASLAPTGGDKAQSGTLIIIDGDLFAPTFDDVNQGPLPTYTAGFANVQELASLGPDGAIYNMWQVSNDQRVLLGPELATNGDASDDTYTDSSIHTLAGWGNTGTHNATNKTTIESNQFRTISSGDFTGIQQLNTLEVGKTYLMTIDIKTVNFGELKIQGADSSIILNDIGSIGIKKAVFTATHITVNVSRQTACDIIFDDFSLKELF